MSWNHKSSSTSILRQFQLQSKIFSYLLLLVLPTLAIITITGCFSLLEEETVVLGWVLILIIFFFSAIASSIANDNLEWAIDCTNFPKLEVPIVPHYSTVSLVKALTRLDAVNRELEERIADLNGELYSAKVAVETASQAKSNFLAEMSDELRTPLNAIVVMSQIMQQEAEITRSQQADLDLIHRNSQQLVTAIDKMLMRSRLEGQSCFEPYVNRAISLPAKTVIEPSALQVMPQEWLVQLERAASELDKEAIAPLLDSIPNEHTLLAQSLHSKIDNFDFEEITHLVRLVRQ